ncbi:MAG: AAA family ATPase [Alistipes sp.]|nr:AAA family ATPase [Alistipes sp.]
MAEKRLVVVRRRKNGSYGYRVSNSVVKAIQNNTPIEPEPLSGLSTRTIFSRLHNIFGDIVNDVMPSDIGLNEIFDIMNNNVENKFVETVIQLGINKMDDPDEILLMFYMLHRNIAFGENYFTIDEFSKLLNNSMGLSNPLFDAMQQGESNLQKKGLLEFQCVDGLENREVFTVPEPVLNKLLADLGINNSTPIASIPTDELIIHSNIRTKNMYYNDKEAAQVHNLTTLLCEEKFSQVRERFNQKGLRCGFCCLFYGAAGTGKTETVMQIARETGRNIFIVDMSKLRSKWVGDSEKNIKQVFNSYRNIVNDSPIAPILLFNEADAIFGRRLKEDSPASKTNNAIQNIILQEMETLDGILIATTNLTENFDPAFERRFLYKIQFQVPSTAVKAKIWMSMVDVVTEDDAQTLASKFSFTGGQIENISRKLDVDYILSGTVTSMEKIISICNDECIKQEGVRRRIGF